MAVPDENPYGDHSRPLTSYLRGGRFMAADRCSDLGESEAEVAADGSRHRLRGADVVIEQSGQITVASLGSDPINGSAVRCGHRRVPGA